MMPSVRKLETWLERLPSGIASVEVFVRVELDLYSLSEPVEDVTADEIKEGLRDYYRGGPNSIAEGAVRSVWETWAQLPSLERVHFHIAIWGHMSRWNRRRDGVRFIQEKEEHMEQAAEERVLSRTLRADMKNAGLKLSVDFDLGPLLSHY
jgi:hypothetical protein